MKNNFLSRSKQYRVDKLQSLTQNNMHMHGNQSVSSTQSSVKISINTS